MKVKKLLDRAKKCTTDEECAALLNVFINAFLVKASVVRHLEVNNADYSGYGMDYFGYVRDFFMSFELNRALSDHYVTMISPRIHDGELTILIETNHMLDGLGTSSRNWNAVIKDHITIFDEIQVVDAAKRASELAILHHQQLIQRIGVPEEIAKATAKKCW